MRERSYSRFVIEESERILVAMGAECKINNPSGLPLPNIGAIQPTQGKTFAVMQVNGGTQIFNVVNQLGVLGRWMRMNTISNQSSAPKVFQEFDENGRMKPSGYYNRIVDVLEGIMKFTLLTREQSDFLVDRYTDRVEKESSK